MTRISFTRSGGKITGFCVQGHSGYAEQGEDIVCAAVSSVVDFCSCLFEDVYHLKTQFRVDESVPVIELLPQSGTDGENETRNAVLQGMYIYFSALQKQFPEYIEIMEV